MAPAGIRGASLDLCPDQKETRDAKPKYPTLYCMVRREGVGGCTYVYIADMPAEGFIIPDAVETLCTVCFAVHPTSSVQSSQTQLFGCPSLPMWGWLWRARAWKQLLC